jgi:type IV pilus assembly protein PilB
MEEKIKRSLDQYYKIASSIEHVMKEIPEEKIKYLSEELKEIKVEEEERNAPIIRLLNLIILQGIRDKASDIHIEPGEKKVLIRYRIDGILHEAFSPPKHLQHALISRIKVLGNMDITEMRVPQDGRFKMRLEDNEIEFRVSSFPTIYGENMVLRILDQSSAILRLQDLGFAKETLNLYENVLSNPYGIVLVTGPTGSGKTTTLYATLNTINSIEKNIITIEDPVEYRGRTGLFELMLVDEEIRKLILKRASSSELLEAAQATQKMKTLREDGLEKSLKGITTLEEVNRVCF